jgi:lysophospholipase L1-like esterase
MSFRMDQVFHRALAPLVRTWASAVGDGLAGVPVPLDPPRVHAPGPDSDRVLVLGAGPAVGRGVSSHDLALPGALARALTAKTGRGTDVNVISDSTLDIRNARDALEAAMLWRYDAIVLTLGANDALAVTSIRVWEEHLAALLSEIEALAAPRAQVFVVGVQPIRSIPGFDSPLGGLAGRRAELINGASSELCSGRPHATFVPLAALPKQSGERFRSPDGYTQWGRDLAEAIAPVLDSGWRAVSDPAAVAGGGGVADARQRAVDGLALAADGTERRLNYVVELAQRLFGTEIALFTVLDKDWQRHVARTGTELLGVPLADSFCNVAIGYRDGMMIPDARQDPRFRDNPLVRGDPKARFYAGYPIESPSGDRIGALCLLDAEPRAVEEVDLGLLRELALLIQRELWRPGFQRSL